MSLFSSSSSAWSSVAHLFSSSERHHIAPSDPPAHKYFIMEAVEGTQQPSRTLPSLTMNGHWITATDKSGLRSANPVNVGKWLIFPKKEELDADWEKIRIATENGQLSFASKVSTAHHMRENGNNSTGVICVYTPDCDDEKDVMSVREELRNLGFTQKLYYKSDNATYSGLYSARGSRGISMYQA